MSRKNLIVVILLAFAIGTVVSAEVKQKTDRPFLKLLAIAARIGLSIMVFEPPPEEVHVRHDPDHINHLRSL